jgi:Helix-turn-helix domain
MHEAAVAYFRGTEIMVHESCFEGEPEARRRRPRDRADVAALLAAGVDPFLDLTTAASYAGVGRRTVERWVALPPDEALPACRMQGMKASKKGHGGKVLIRRSEMDAFIERHRSRGRPSLARALREMGLVRDDA